MFSLSPSVLEPADSKHVQFHSFLVPDIHLMDRPLDRVSRHRDIEMAGFRPADAPLCEPRDIEISELHTTMDEPVTQKAIRRQAAYNDGVGEPQERIETDFKRDNVYLHMYMMYK